MALLFVSLFYPSLAQSAPQDDLKASKILFSDVTLARKIAISYHHAILETNYEKGYIIADLTGKEISKLQLNGIKVEKANAWNKKYQLFRSKVNQQLSKQAANVRPAGIPGFECYPTVEETLAEGSRLSISYPNFTDWIDIGDSWKKANGQSGYNLMVLKITNKQIVEDKPKLFIHSSMHAREYTPAALTLDFAKLLLEQYSTNPDIQWIVDYHEVHILFHMNPDGRKAAETGILQRKNMNDNHCVSGTSTGDIGVDLNRNFAFFWNSTANGSSGVDCSQVFRGVSAESEPETQAVSNYIRSLFPDARGPNDDDGAPTDTSGMHIDIHSYSQLVLWPYGHKVGVSPNDQGFVSLGNKLAWFNNYAPMQSVGLYPTDGTSDDVSYGELGIAAFTFELGTSFFQQCSDYTNRIQPDNLNALVYAAKATAAPYTLASGAEVTSIELNGTNGGVTVTQGSVVNISATGNVLRTKLQQLGPTLSKAEYSIDTPIWKPTATLIELTDNDGTLSSGIEVFNGQIDTSNLGAGTHTIYVRAYDGAGNYGVPTATSVTISQNNSPTPDFSFTCTDLSCDFDASNSSDSDGTITSYSWDFNGENSGSGQTTSYTFAQAGDKQISLTLTDDTNNQAVKNANVTVTAPVVTPPPPPPPPASSSGGGSLLFLNVFGLLILMRRRKLASC